MTPINELSTKLAASANAVDLLRIALTPESAKTQTRDNTGKFAPGGAKKSAKGTKIKPAFYKVKTVKGKGKKKKAKAKKRKPAGSKTVKSPSGRTVTLTASQQKAVATLNATQRGKYLDLRAGGATHAKALSEVKKSSPASTASAPINPGPSETARAYADRIAKLHVGTSSRSTSAA